MRCEEVSEFFVPYLCGELPNPQQGEFLVHLETCHGCRAELAELKATWAILDHWPEVAPEPAIGRRLLRQVRWLALRDAAFSLDAWRGALLPATVGLLLSLGLSAVIPYDALVEFCRRALGGLAPGPLAFLVAGLAYGLLPLGLAIWLTGRRHATHSRVQGLEATVFFLALLLPYAAYQCRGFPAPGLAGFLTGMVLGGLLGSLTAGWRWAGRHV